MNLERNKAVVARLDELANGTGDIDTLHRLWLFDEQRSQRRKRFNQLHGNARLWIVNVDCDIDAGAGAFFHRGKTRRDMIDLCCAGDALGHAEMCLERFEAPLMHQLMGIFGPSFRRVAVVL